MDSRRPLSPGNLQKNPNFITTHRLLLAMILSRANLTPSPQFHKFSKHKANQGPPPQPEPATSGPLDRTWILGTATGRGDSPA